MRGDYRRYAALCGQNQARRPLQTRPLRQATGCQEAVDVGSQDMQSLYSAGMTDPNSAIDPPTRVAIEFLTLWMEPDRQFAAEHITQALGDPGTPGRDHAIAGLLNLSMILAIELAQANGAEDHLAWVADHLRRMSPEIPD